MTLLQRVTGTIQHFWRMLYTSHAVRGPQMIALGWDKYAREWKPDKFSILPGHRVHYLGDEWTVEDVRAGGTTYGLAPDVVANFEDHITKQLLNPYLPSFVEEGLEIGPGGGRLTALLVPRTKMLHVADPSETMLRHLSRRFADVSNVRYYHTGAMTLPALRPESLDYVIAFDVFVHFDPRLVYWYLRQIRDLLKPGGTGIIHYANVLTPIGWEQFEMDLESNVQDRTTFASFGVMCPELMGKFLAVLKFEVISTDSNTIPRDAIAVFRNSARDVAGL